MSYDLHVYAPVALTADELRAVISDAGLSVVDDDAGSSLTVTRGARRTYSFTVDLPVSIDAEDVPDEVAAVLLDAAFMYEILVEGSSQTEIPRAVRTGRRLAQATSGALIDEQLGQIWTRGKLRAAPGPESGIVSIIDARWYVRSDFDTAETAATWIRLARKRLPEALPRRYGTYEPLTHKLDIDGEQAFIDFVRNADGTVHYDGRQPVHDGHIDVGRQLGNASAHGLTLLAPALDDPRWRAALRGLFIDFALAVDAIVATAEVVRGVHWSGRSLGYNADTETTAHLAWKDIWQGLPPYPVWWTWFGPDYAKAVIEHLPRDQVETFGSSLFHWHSDAPADRDALADASASRSGNRSVPSLGNAGERSSPWLPPDFLLTKKHDAIMTYGVPQRARWVPPSLA